MKNHFIKYFLIFSIISLLNFSLFAEDAIVTSIKGKVEVSHGNDTWVSLNVGDSVSESDIVSTGFQSEAKIKYNGSIMLMGALTRVTLSQLSTTASTDKVDVFLNTGAVRSKVTHTSDKKVDYKVRSSIAVASVRGTDFITFANGTVRCFEGAVAVYPAKYYVEETTSDENNAEEESADESEEENGNEPSDEQEENNPEEPEAPGDESSSSEPQGDNPGPADATTPPGDISSNNPNNAVVVGEGMSTKLKKDGTMQKPAEKKTEDMNKLRNQFTPESEKESSEGGTDTPVAPSYKTTGKIVVEIEFE